MKKLDMLVKIMLITSFYGNFRGKHDNSAQAQDTINNESDIECKINDKSR